MLEDGATLAAGTGGWTGTEPLIFTYQWQRCDADGANCEDIDGATDPTYTLTADDVAGTVRVIVTATNAAGADTSTSPATDTVAPSAPVSTTPPAVTGSPVDGQTLTADPGSFSGTGPLTYEYQWQRCEADGSACADIPGATDSTYDLVSADVGGAIVVVVTATNDADSATASSPATTEVQALAPANVSAPTISGDPLDGETLTADPGTWTGTTPVTYTYQWQRCDEDGTNCVDILGAVDPTYTLVPGDIDHVLTVVVTATNAGGSVPSAAAPTVTAEAAPPANTVVPTVSGTPEDGETLTADPGTWSGTAPVTYTYEWQRCEADGSDCDAIPGATGSTYVLLPTDVGHAIVVEVTGTNAAGADSATSVPSSSVAVDPPATAGTPAATGTPVDGQTLTAEPGTWTGTGPIDFTYQWQRCDAAGANCVDIPGATDATYTLGTDDLGSTVRVVVTGDNGEQTEVPSTAVGPIAALPPASTSVPTVSGTVADGHTLTAGDGAWDGSLPLTFTYQWQRCDAAGANCVDVPGADEPTYDLTDADVGHTIRVEVTAANSAGDDTAVSAPTVQTLPAPPVNTTQPPAPTGTGVDGGTPDRRSRRVDRRRSDHLHLPVAALRRRRHRLRGHRRRHRRDLLAGPRRRRPRARRRGHRDEPGRLVHGGLRADRHADRRQPAAQHDRADHRRHPGRRRDADRRPRHLVGHADDHLRAPVAALRRRRHRTASTSRAPPTTPTRRPAPTRATRSSSSSPRPTRAAPPPRPPSPPIRSPPSRRSTPCRRASPAPRPTAGR